jgi:hypothetical protein
MTRKRRHHNNYGKTTIQKEWTYEQVKKIAKKLNIPTKRNNQPEIEGNFKTTLGDKS